MVGSVPQGGAGLEDAKIQSALEVDEGVVSPQVVAELLTQYGNARTGEQQAEDAGRLRREFDGLAIAAQLVGSKVELERTEPAASCLRR
jgi:hypothetical protein